MIKVNKRIYFINIKVNAFKKRTCVKFYIENNEETGFSKIIYEADPIQFESGTSDERLDCINFLERAFLYSMAITIFLGVVSVAHIALIKMDFIAEIKSWRGHSKIRRVHKTVLTIHIHIYKK